MATDDWKPESAKERKARRAQQRRERDEHWERLLDQPALMGRVKFRRGDEEDGVGRVDGMVAEELEKLRLKYERDRSAIFPLQQAVEYLFQNAVVRAGVGLAAPQWPGWVACGVKRVLETLVDNEDVMRRRGRTGRHAKESTRRHGDRNDLKRAKAVQAGLDKGLSFYAACHKAEEALKGTAAAISWKAMGQAYKRVQARFPRDPSRYTG